MKPVKTRQEQNKTKKNNRPIFLMNLDAKILKNTGKPDSTTYQKDHTP
jgi:hypothetical protein